MASFKPKLPIIDSLLTKKPPTVITELSNVASKAMRFKVLLDRKKRGFQQAEINGPTGAYEFSGKSDGISKRLKQSNNKTRESQGYTFEQKGSKHITKITGLNTDSISIINIDGNPIGFGQDALTNYDYIELPFVPSELDYSTSSKFVGIATLGRNNPYYQFTGSEDTLQFDIDWFSKDPLRRDVINNCRWLEALTKGDAYLAPPPRIVLSWGNDNLLWGNYIWIVTSASFKLSNFNRGYRKVIINNSNGITKKQFINTNLLPQQAYQTIVLKRLTNINLTTNQIKNQI